ncbi:MAG: glycosyltransferase [Planctomyces sp.]|nr:glycosyltransferase [Planctomyces sp.]
MSAVSPYPAFPTPDTAAEFDALKATNSCCRSVEGASGGEPIRIGHISMTLRTGGLERLLVEFGRHADRSRFQLQFIALADAGPPADDLRKLGFAVHVLGYPACGKMGLLHSLKSLIREGGFDILHTHNTYAHFLGTIAAKAVGTRVIINTQHGRGCGGRWKDRWKFRIANRFTDRIVGVSDDATSLCRRQDSFSSRKMLRIWNGIDVERFRLTGPAPRPTAISVARLSPEKDFTTLIQATALVHRAAPDFRLRIVGDGVERPALERLTLELGLEGVVAFLGERQDVPALLPQAGFFVTSSRTEGVSLTLLEAMSVGLPVVATAVGGNPEVVTDGRTGLLAPPRQPQELARAMLDMCRRQDRWPEMGRAGRERVENHFDVRKTVENYETLYEHSYLQKR